MPDIVPKLTKKQRKGLAFRQKLGNKNRSSTRPEPEDVPEAELIADDDERDASNLSVHTAADLNLPDRRREKERGRGKTQENGREGDVKLIDAHQSRKRKRPQAGTESFATPNSKKRKPEDADENGEDATKKDTKSEKQKTRYILFVGNLKYTTSKETIAAHFAHCDPPPTIRLLTPKSSSFSIKSTSKSKGCAFLEFSTPSSLQRALKLHHSTLDGRQINVELTAGGGGKGEKRKEKVRGRNRRLEGERKKHLQKPSSTTDTSSSDRPTDSPRPQRHSTTSGTSPQPPTTKRTWSIPEGGEEGANRGGKKRGVKKRKANVNVRDLGTGVNAIPVGS